MCKIKFKNYKITLYGCKNNDKLKNIEFKNFFETQNIGKSKIKCDNCNKNEGINKYNEYYTCLECNKFFCKLCKEMHDQQHTLFQEVIFHPLSYQFSKNYDYFHIHII